MVFYGNPESNLFWGSATVFVTIPVICVCITFTFTILIFIYIKANVIGDNVDVKQAVAKILYYLLIDSVLAFSSSILPAANPGIREALEGNVIGQIAVAYFLRVLFNLPSIATPIVSIVLLKPLRTAMKQLLMKFFCACNKTNQSDTRNRVNPE